MHRRTRSGILAIIGIGLGAAGALGRPDTASAFTQGVSGGGYKVPMGHEWITRQAALELLGGDKVIKNDRNDPRENWPAQHRADPKALELTPAALNVKTQILGLPMPADADNRFAATYKPVFDAIIGERWVDIGGVNKATAFALSKVGSLDCLDMVTQEPVEVQYDHFMRRYDDKDGEGGIRAAKESTERFKRYFVNAVMAQKGDIKVWDGGAMGTLETVDRRYFLFGRALHLFEDSFSPDHTVRLEADGFRRVRQVKSYLCASGSEQHAHATPMDSKFYDTGDVIWNVRLQSNDWSRYKPSHIRPPALAAIEATKEAWAAFIRALANPKDAQTEADNLAKKWLSYDEKEMRGWYGTKEHRDRAPTYVSATRSAEDQGGGVSQAACMKADWEGRTQAAQVKLFEEGQRKCLYNMVALWEGQTDVDGSLHVGYHWDWRNSKVFEDVPKDWKIGDPQIMELVKLKNRKNQAYMRREGEYLYNDAKPGTKPVVFRLTGSRDSAAFQVDDMPGHYMNLSAHGNGRVNIWNSAQSGYLKIIRRPDGFYNLQSTAYNQYLYIYNDNPFVNKDIDKEGKDAQWSLEGLPELELLDAPHSFFSEKYRIPCVKQAPLLSNTSLVGCGRAADAVVDIKRQKDGTHTLTLNGRSLLSVTEGDKTLIEAIPSPSSPSFLDDAYKFYLERQPNGLFMIKNKTDGRYWRFFNDGKVATVPDLTGCFLDPCKGGAVIDTDGPSGASPSCDKVPLPDAECLRELLFNIQQKKKW